MADCCPPKQQHKLSPRQHVCPENGHCYKEVPFQTVLHHVKKPWEAGLANQTYYFCEDPDCDVVYFGIDNTIVTQPMLRSRIGIKEKAADAPICYCFGVSRAEAVSNELAKTFVVEQTKAGRCSCETSNPSGRCCLKDFPK
ncbi:MAG: hypothetical protein PVJ39_14955 [Gammaproteobacteria bacterium]|jgi:hypothetical protein